MDKQTRPEGAKDLPHLQCGTRGPVFQTFHVWLLSLGGFAALHPGSVLRRRNDPRYKASRFSISEVNKIDSRFLEE